MGPLSQLATGKIAFLPKPDGHTDGYTYRWSDISNYRVALPLKKEMVTGC